MMITASPTMAQDLSFRGLAVGRVVAPSSETPSDDGGFGRLRFGAEDSDPSIQLSDLYLVPHFQATSTFSVTATLKRDPEQDAPIDIVEGFTKWKPVSRSPWRFSARAGAFFPPISFENEDTGWTSDFTATTSAINSWFGEELRILGAEGSLAYRQQNRTIKTTASLFGGNDPFGILLGVRGWGLTDRTTGILDTIRLPDTQAQIIGAAPPRELEIIREIDDKPGFYIGAEWDEHDRFRIRLLRYDNRADPAASRNGQQAWRTQFWSAGASAPIGAWTLISQGIIGHTDIVLPQGLFSTDYSSAFILVARDIHKFRLSGRAEFFRTDETVIAPGVADTQGRKEDGGAATFAVRWFAHENAEIVAEALQVWSDRPERTQLGLSESAEETQLQLLVRGRF